MAQLFWWKNCEFSDKTHNFDYGYQILRQELSRIILKKKFVFKNNIWSDTAFKHKQKLRLAAGAPESLRTELLSSYDFKNLLLNNKKNLQFIMINPY
jgi:hypothetical protein